MPFIPALNTAKVALEYALGSETVVNTLYFRQITGSVDAASLDAMVVEVRNWARDVLMPVLSDELTLTQVIGTDLTTASSFQASRSPNEVGGLPGGISPNNVAYCLKFVTGFSGRSRRGRNYIAAIREADVVGNYLIESQASAFIGAYQQILTGNASQPTNWEWVVVSNYSNNAPRPSALITPITDVVVTDLRVDTMRKRLPKG